MFPAWIRFFVLTATFCAVKSVYNPEICSIVKESSGPIPPPLPTDFEMRAEHIDYNKKTAIYEELYLDYRNSRAKYMYLMKGIEHHFLFDYEVHQVIEYDVLHPGTNFIKDPMSHTCTAVDMDESEYTSLLGDEQGDMGGKPKIHNSNKVLMFGGKYIYSYLGTTRMDQRGLLVDKFIGCLYDDDIDATINSTFSFTSKRNLGVASAGGTTEEEVTGIENGMLSVPVRADVFGSMPGPKDDDKGVLFNKTINYFWFKGDPQFKPETFRIPPYLYCSEYRGRKEMPAFPTAFSTRVQKTRLETDILGKLSTSEVTSFETIYYDKEKNLARRDFTPGPHDTEIKWKFLNTEPVKTIFDFNGGLLYTSHIASGRCYIRPIDHNDFFETSENILYISIATPQQIFQMETDDMEYKGKDFTRDIECDVWAGKYYDKIHNATYAKETYISTNGWHEDADEMSEFGVPIKHTIIQKELNGELAEGVTSYSFMKFKAKGPPLRDFDISNCIEGENVKDFAILLTISQQTKKLLLDYRWQFLDVAQAYINEVAQLMSPLRVQRLQFRTVSQANPRPVLLVTLVDKIKLKTKVPVAQRGANLEDATAFLFKHIDTNQFAIKFYPPNSKEMVLVPALSGSLYVKTSTGDLTYYAPVDERESNIPLIMHDNPLDDKEKNEGMTSTSLSLLAFAMLFIGIGIGVAIMYLYLRQQRESQMEDRIHLSMKNKEDHVHIDVPSISGAPSTSKEGVSTEENI